MMLVSKAHDPDYRQKFHNGETAKEQERIDPTNEKQIHREASKIFQIFKPYKP
jgi:hypothetical protein